MDSKEINLVNQAIIIMKTLCQTQSCDKCPMWNNCGELPHTWETIPEEKQNDF